MGWHHPAGRLRLFAGRAVKTKHLIQKTIHNLNATSYCTSVPKFQASSIAISFIPFVTISVQLKRTHTISNSSIKAPKKIPSVLQKTSPNNPIVRCNNLRLLPSSPEAHTATQIEIHVKTYSPCLVPPTRLDLQGSSCKCRRTSRLLEWYNIKFMLVQ